MADLNVKSPIAQQPSYEPSPHIQQEQPMPIPMMQSSGPGLEGNRNSLNKPLNKDGTREWSHDLCSFTEDCGTCIMGCICPCSLYGQNLTRRDHLTLHGRPDPTGGDTCGSDTWQHCCLSYLCCGMGIFLLQSRSRGNTRIRYNIEGNTCTDCLTSCFCSPCALTQEAREIELEENSIPRKE